MTESVLDLGYMLKFDFSILTRFEYASWKFEVLIIQLSPCWQEFD